MRINSSGNVSIGALNSPSAKLLVATSEGTVPKNASSYNGALRLTSTATAGVGVGPSITFRGQTGNATAEYGFAGIQGIKNSSTANDYGGALAFFTQNSGGATNLSERVRIDHLGNMMLGTNQTASSGVAVATGKNFTFSEGNTTTSYANIFRQANSGATVLANGYRYSGTANKMQSSLSSSWAKSAVAAMSGRISFYVDAASADAIGTDLTPTERVRIEADGDLHADGNVIAYSTTISDERLKTDIKRIDGALDKVCALSGYTFTYKHDGKASAGVVAQEVEKVLPSAVVEKELAFQGDDEAYKIVQYDQLHGLLIEAIKELKAEIEELKNGSTN